MHARRADVRVFLDANVLFSAAYRENAGLAVLWELRGTQLLTSAYAVQEAAANLREESQQSRLRYFANLVELADSGARMDRIAGIDLPDKDRPILAAAVEAKANYLLTGDIQHFGKYFGKIVCGVRVERPAEFLKLVGK